MVCRWNGWLALGLRLGNKKRGECRNNEAKKTTCDVEQGKVTPLSVKKTVGIREIAQSEEDVAQIDWN